MKTGRALTTEEERLVKENVGLAQYLYWQYLNRFQKNIDFQLDQDELLSQAYLGLIRAAMRYRAYGESHGYSEESIRTGQYFGVFARKGIIGQMLDSLRKIDHVHTLVRKDYKTLVSHGHGSKKITDEELAELSGLSVNRIQKVVRSINSRPVSLNEGADEENEFPLEDQISRSEDVESSAAVVAVRNAFVDRVEELPPLQQIIIVLKYYSDMELPAIAEELSLTLTKVRSAHTEALVSIHEAMHESIRDVS